MYRKPIQLNRTLLDQTLPEVHSLAGIQEKTLL